MPSDFRVPMAPVLDAFGVPATVTPLDEDAIETVGVWILPTTPDFPGEQEFERREPQRLMAFDRDAVPSLPRGSTVVAPERLGELTRTWTVDSHVHSDADHVRVLLVPADEST